MEVHHPHHAAHTKKWTAYVLEFLMLFLAVFLGFVAENIREHAVEKTRAKELLKSFVVDLKKDTSELNQLQNFRKNYRRPRLDSFYTILNTPPEKVERAVFFRLLKRIGGLRIFSQSTGTLNQLKNAGYLRYFSDPQLLNHISDYEYIIQDFKADENIEMHIQYDKLMFLLKQNIDNNDAYSTYIEGRVLSGQGIKPFKPEVLENIKSVLIDVMSHNQVVMTIQNESVKAKATEILNYLRDTYKVE